VEESGSDRMYSPELLRANSHELLSDDDERDGTDVTSDDRDMPEYAAARSKSAGSTISSCRSISAFDADTSIELFLWLANRCRCTGEKCLCFLSTGAMRSPTVLLSAGDEAWWCSG
jgi:hypothetical protein